ncbi:amino acid adenylation domain-containing protein [Kineosporia sp. J2-2]|uniref:Phenyloxazoline synthase MbtB n=1 Tax=Kineosporia corallincola TaxID=2835133 RepID=A0ABS5TTD3_9ACTN|nr:non-ribosomal peptide synthetase [Kineosporia corallincola]MBT0774020.1 amino acid adenylation domain-containing protein [Kineosporia corallincola]
MTRTPDPIADLADALDLDPDEIHDDTDLFELGLDSLTVIRLAGRWRRSGYQVGFADLVENPTPAGWRAALSGTATGTAPAHESATVDDETPFDLATLQHAYWVGRQDGQPFGGVAAHFYVELDGQDVEPDRLRDALRRITARHKMLRMRMTPQGQQWTAPASSAAHADITVHDLRRLDDDARTQALETAREQLTHRRMDVDAGQVLDLRLSLLPGGATRLHVDLDMIAADALSLRVLVADLAHAYQDPTWTAPEPESSYQQYLSALAQVGSVERERDRDWWSARAADLPGAPGLPLLPDAGTPALAARSVRLHHWADPQTTAQLGRAAATNGVTLAAALATAFAESIGAWCENPEFLLNLPLFARQPIVPQVDDLLGDFSSSVLLPVDLSHPATFAQRATRIRADLHAAVAHGSYGGVEVLRDLARLRGGTVLAPVVYTSAVGLGEIYGPAVRACFGSPVWTVSQGPQVWLDAQVTEHEGGLLLNWDVRLDALREAPVRAAFDAYRALVTALAEDPGAWQRPGTPPPPAPRPELDASARRHPPRLLQTPFLDRARTAPDHPALIFGESTLTYGELAGRAGRTARELTRAGAAPGDSVLITLPKGPDQVIAALGVLLAGCTYVPVGIDQPATRRARIQAAAGARLALTTGDLMDDVRSAGAHPLLVPEGSEEFGVPSDPADIAYVLFTSGSTGEPKGVEISHAAAANTIDALNQRFGIGPDDRVLTVSALEFDLSVYDMFGLLAAGGTLVLLPQEQRADPPAWYRSVLRHGVSVWNTVPAVFGLLLGAAEAAGQTDPAGAGLPLRTVLLGGDRVTGDLPGRLHALAPHARFAALGGMTEAAIHSTVFEVGPGESGDPADPGLPWGVPLDGVACRVVDAAGHDRPDDVIGELWMGGAGLARGYRGDPERTSGRFVHEAGRRWYRTGDLAVVRPGGLLEFAGRADHQVKVNGHRIEPGEIEAVLSAHPGVSAASVQAISTGAGTHLAALVVTGAPHSALHDWLAGHLPPHMRCAWFAGAEALPLSRNGKIDRAAVQRLLLASTPHSTTGRTGEAPSSELERSVARAWQDLLGTGPVTRDDDFFALGGDSLLATRLLVTLDQLGVQGASLGAVFSRPRLADLCTGLVLGAGQADPPADGLEEVAGGGPAHRHDPFPLTDVQRAYLIGRDPDLPLGGVGTWQYNEFDGEDVDLDRLQRAWDAVQARHDMLRAVIEDGAQRVPEKPEPVRIVVQDVTGDPEAALSGLRRRLSHRMVDLARGPLVEIGAVRYRRDGQVRTRLGIGYDYIVLDALSIMRVLTELDTRYTDPEADLGPVGPLFRDYVLAHEGHQPDPGHLAHWERRLAELPPGPELPLTRSPETVSGASFERRQHLLAPELWQGLQERARRYRVTVPSVLLAAYGEVLARWSGSDGVTVTLTRFDRRPVHPRIDLAVGDFTTLAPAGYRRPAGTGFAEAVRAVHRRTGEDLDHSDVPASWLLRRLASAGGEGRPVPVVFTSAVGVAGDVTMDRSPGFPQPVWGLSQSPQVCLDNQVLPAHGGLQVTWDAAAGLLRESVLDDMFEAYLTLLTALARPDGDDTLPDLLPPSQRSVRQQVSATGDGGEPVTLLAPVLERIAAAPERPALIDRDGTVTTYGALGEDVRRWTGLLAAHGVRPGDLVAITLPKGPVQVTAALGVLAAGAAYVPVGVTTPPARRSALYRLAGVRHVITDESISGSDGFAVLDPSALAGAVPADPVPASPGDLAYVIFTSGSTGAPKGVETTHDAAANTCRDIVTRYRIGPEDRVLALSSLEFDLSVFDVFGTLGAGGTVVLPGEGERRDPAGWLEQVDRQRVTVWNTVPALLDLLITEAGDSGRADSLRLALVSGDWVGLDLAARLRRITAGRSGSPARLVALGGATEAAIWSNAFEVGEVPEHWTSIPYGFALSGQRYRVVGPSGHDAPDGVPGELWIGGRGVARGYRGEPERTAERFVLHEGERWYRTGDLGRFWADGTLEFLGRTDHQVKINGHRLELGEVEAALEALPGVHRAVVAAPGARGRRVLHAVIEAPADVTDPRAALEAVLPAHAVPSRIIRLDALPLTPNGKVDRAAVLALTTEEPAGNPSHRRELSAAQAALAPLWEEATGSGVVDPDEGFFASGGDSLTALRLVATVRERFGVPLSARDLFAAPTLTALARHLEKADDTWRRDGVDEGTL